jgi:monoamine oxidase
MTTLDIAIIGGGLSGLSLAKYLLDAGRKVRLFESRDRFGGRIISLPVGNHRHDLGPSWVWPLMQPRLSRFIEAHNIEVFPQWLSGNSLYQPVREMPPQSFVDHSTYESARRIRGGAYALVEVLLQQLPESLPKLNHHLQEVVDQHDHVVLNFNHQSEALSVKAKQVVITVPPRLLVNTVTFTPGLDARLSKVMNETATWMAGHAKAVIRYSRPFWRDAGLSGSVLADYPGAAMAEIFDACSGNHEHAALSGFLALPPSLRQRYADDLPALIREQLVRLFGREAAQPEEILIKDWFAEPATATHEDEIPPPAHPQYGHAWLQLDHWNDKLYFSGTETAPQFGGYLEGALESTERVAKALLI